MQTLGRIIITGAFRFPEGDAAAARVLGIGKALQVAGYNVCFAGWEEAGRLEDLQSDGNYKYQDFDYVSQNDLRHVRLSIIKKIMRYFLTGKNTIKWLRSEDLADVRVIIVYHGVSLFLLRLAFICRRRKVKLLFDCTEWYKASNLLGGIFGPVALDNEIRMRWINRYIGRGLVISKFLENYYQGYKCNVLRVPPLIDFEEEKWSKYRSKIFHRQSLKLVYAGTPGKKDILKNALQGLLILKTEGCPVELCLIGPTQEMVEACVGYDFRLLQSLGDTLVINGRVSQSQVPHLLASADFSILIRPYEKYAEAGFSTKFVESLAAGVPVITNPTGDILDFVQDGKEAILLADHSVESFVAGVKRALALSPEERFAMKKAAQLLARRCFDFNKYVSVLGDFISSEEVKAL